MAKSTYDHDKREEDRHAHESEAARRAREAETSPASPESQPAAVPLRWFGHRDDRRLQYQQGNLWYDIPEITEAQAEANRAAELARQGPVATNPFQPGAPGTAPVSPGGPSAPQTSGEQQGAAEPSNRDRRD